MKVLVTGAKGFIGRNLCLSLRTAGIEVFEDDVASPDGDLKNWVSACDFIVHLAGINRPLNPQEFIDGNVNFTKKLLDIIAEAKCRAPLIFSSSTQAALDNPYGRSKKMAEEEIFAFSKERDYPVYVFRLANAFGKWCRPNYNSVIATWCYNVSRGLPIDINEAAGAIDFVYIDDIVAAFLNIIQNRPAPERRFYAVEPVYTETLKAIAEALYSFRDSRQNFMVPNVAPGFYAKLYATYISYLDEKDFAYPLAHHSDARGSFAEFLKTLDHGQVSVNVAHPGVTKGNHYHMTKCERFVVVGGTCEIRFRRVGDAEVFSYVCSGDEMKAVDIPPGYAHSITNIGASDSVTIMWADELYDGNNPDTIPCIV